MKNPSSPGNISSLGVGSELKGPPLPENISIRGVSPPVASSSAAVIGDPTIFSALPNCAVAVCSSLADSGLTLESFKKESAADD